VPLCWEHTTLYLSSGPGSFSRKFSAAQVTLAAFYLSSGPGSFSRKFSAAQVTVPT